MKKKDIGFTFLFVISLCKPINRHTVEKFKDIIDRQPKKKNFQLGNNKTSFLESQLSGNNLLQFKSAGEFRETTDGTGLLIANANFGHPNRPRGFHVSALPMTMKPSRSTK